MTKKARSIVYIPDPLQHFPHQSQRLPTLDGCPHRTPNPSTPPNINDPTLLKSLSLHQPNSPSHVSTIPTFAFRILSSLYPRKQTIHSPPQTLTNQTKPHHLPPRTKYSILPSRHHRTSLQHLSPHHSPSPLFRRNAN